MSRELRIRELGRVFARNARPHPDWNSAKQQQIASSEELAQRRNMRIFRRGIFEHRTFHRLLDHLEEFKVAYDIVTVLMILKVFASRAITPEDAKGARRKFLNAKSDVVVAARVLREYARSPEAPKDHQQALLLAAERIEQTPAYAIEDRLRSAATLVDFGLFGQKGDKRASQLTVYTMYCRPRSPIGMR